VNSFAKFALGQSKHVIHCNDAGKIIHEGILSPLGDDEFMLFGRGGFWVDYKLRHGRYDASSEPDDWSISRCRDRMPSTLSKRPDT
jgi:vanillate/3-O-methylgallate O-demethylase